MSGAREAGSRRRTAGFPGAAAPPHAVARTTVCQTTGCAVTSTILAREGEENVSTVEQRPEDLLQDKRFPSAEVTQCPFPVYSAFRRESPAYQLPSGEYVVSRHADILEITRKPEVFSSNHSVFEDGWMRAGTVEDHENPDYPWAIVSSDPPRHTVKRKLAFEMFKPGRLRGREPMVRDFADQLIDRFIDNGACEFSSEFASLLPAQVILTLFGLPLEHLDRALTWSRYEGFGTRFASKQHQAAARDGILDLGGFLADEIQRRLDEPTDDDLSLLVERHREAAGGQLNLPEIIADGTNLFIGGIITTTHLLSTMMMLFIQHPDQQALARESTSNLKRAVEESLRIDSPVQMGPRLVLQDTELGGVPIPAGSILLLLWGSANRDECVFSEPETFDITRQNVKNHVAFGNGHHFCMGAPLGRMEAQIAFEQIFARMDNLRFGEGNDFRNQEAVIFRGPEKLYIEFDKVA
jgi:cytochrome P450